MRRVFPHARIVATPGVRQTTADTRSAAGGEGNHMNPITMRHIENGELMPDPIYVLWTGSQGDTGEYVSLLTGIPYEAYVLVKHDQALQRGDGVARRSRRKRVCR